MTSERLGIEHLSVFGLPPVEFVNLVADLGCKYLATGLTASPYNPHGYCSFSLRDDAALRREMIAVMRDRGVSISLGEGFSLREGQDVADRRRDLELMADLGVSRINTVSMDPDLGRTFVQLEKLAEMAASFGMETTLDFGPGLSIGNLSTAVSAAREIGRSAFRLLIDTMLLVRSGSGPADLAELDPNLIGYVQLSDSRNEPRFPTYMEEAMFERMVPGQGELPLPEILAALPRDITVGLEVPLRSQAEAGIGPEARLRPCVNAACALLP